MAPPSNCGRVHRWLGDLAQCQSVPPDPCSWPRLRRGGQHHTSASCHHHPDGAHPASGALLYLFQLATGPCSTPRGDHSLRFSTVCAPAPVLGSRHALTDLRTRTDRCRASTAPVAGSQEHPSTESPALAAGEQLARVLYPINGACHRVGPDETAFAYRDANFATVILASWVDPAVDKDRIQWVRDYYQATAPHSEPGGYINFMDDDDRSPIRDNYKGNYDRLVAVKRTYDPDNLFHLNQNISLAG